MRIQIRAPDLISSFTYSLSTVLKVNYLKDIGLGGKKNIGLSTRLVSPPCGCIAV